MQVDIITLFPDMFKGAFNESIIKRAQDKNLIKINVRNLRGWAIDKRGTVDDKPYGGGPGMLLRPEPIFDCVEELKSQKFPPKAGPPLAGKVKTTTKKLKLNKHQDTGTQKQFNHLAIKPFSHIILLDAGGKLYNQKKALELSKLDHLILICGHYEGVDYRVHEYLADEVVSIGDYILTGGEIPAMVIVDSVTRLLPGALQKEDATTSESFSLALKGDSLHACKESPCEKNLLEYPQYTRPEVFHSYKVPEILLSGNHAEIEKWRLKKAIKRTKKLRPQILNNQ